MNKLTNKQLCDLISLVADLVSQKLFPSESKLLDWCEENNIRVSNKIIEHIINVLYAIQRK